MSRTSENPNRAPATSGPPLRAFAMVLISLAILFAGLGFASLGGSDDDPATSAAPDTSTTTATSAAPIGAAAPTSRAADAPAAATTSASAAATTSASAATSGAPTTGAPASGAATGTASIADTSAAATAPVRVFNNSDIAGLAAQTAGYLEDEGFTVTETGNYSEGLLTETSVFYGTSAGEQQTAEAVAEALGVTAQPRFEGIRDAAPGVIVIVTSG